MSYIGYIEKRKIPLKIPISKVLNDPSNCFPVVAGYFRESTQANGSRNLCSPASERRGDGQRVVSFSFYGDLTGRYWRGIRDNLELISDFYPGWVVRLHISREDNSLATVAQLCRLQCSSPQ